MSATLGLCCLFVFAPGEPQLDASHFRVRDPDRDLMLGIAPTVGDKVWTMGSPNPAHWAPELGFRFVFGSWRYNLLVRGAAAPLVPLKGSVAQSQRGVMLDAVVAARMMPIQHRLVRFGIWLGFGFDQIHSRVELAEEDGGASGRKLAGHVGPALGTELAFPLVFPRADRPWSLDIFLSHELRLEIATRTRLRFENENGETNVTHLPKELTVLGPFSGAISQVRVGVEFRYDLITAGRVQPRSGQ